MIDENFKNKHTWIIDNKMANWNLIKETMLNPTKIRFFLKVSEISQLLKNTKTVLPDVIICEFTPSLMATMRLCKSELKGIIVIVSYSLKIPSLQEARELFSLGAKDLCSLNSFNREIFVAKLESLADEKKQKVEINFSSGVKIDGKWIENLTSKQIQFLGLFLGSDDRIISRETILNEIWEGVKVHPKVVDVHLYNLRRKVAPYGFIIQSKGGGRWVLASQSILKSYSSAAEV